MTAKIEADYIVLGAGIAGLAFTDTLIRHCDGTVAIIDRHAAPGGHWNEAYPFVRLHLPSHSYGVNSYSIDHETDVYADGMNRGLCHMATLPELLSYSQRTMDALMSTGRVLYWPMTSFDWATRQAVSIVTGERRAVSARKKFVNGAASGTLVPSAATRPFRVHDDVPAIAIRDLPLIERAFSNYCVVGAGKTGADACLWLLEHAVDAERIRWVMPRDAWWMNRAYIQGTEAALDDGLLFACAMMGAIADADRPDDIFPAMQGDGLCFHLDPQRTPTQYHMASMSRAEFDALRTIKDIQRRGHLTSVSRSELVFAAGSEAAKPDTLYIDCSQNGIAGQPPAKLFEPGMLSLSWTRAGRPAFSAAILGLIEAICGDDDEKNALATPVPVPRYPGDMLFAVEAGAKNTKAWMTHKDIGSWIRSSRLDPTPGLLAAIKQEQTHRVARVGDLARATGRALERLPTLIGMLGTAPPHMRRLSTRTRSLPN